MSKPDGVKWKEFLQGKTASETMQAVDEYFGGTGPLVGSDLLDILERVLDFVYFEESISDDQRAHLARVAAAFMNAIEQLPDRTFVEAARKAWNAHIDYGQTYGVGTLARALIDNPDIEMDAVTEEPVPFSGNEPAETSSTDPMKVKKTGLFSRLFGSRL